MSPGQKILRVVGWTLIGAVASLPVLFFVGFFAGAFGATLGLADVIEMAAPFAIVGAVSGLLQVRERERNATVRRPSRVGGGTDDVEDG